MEDDFDWASIFASVKPTETTSVDDYLKLLDSADEDVGELITLSDCFNMTPDGFQHFMAKLYAKMGYSAAETKHSGDDGCDIILTKGEMKTVVQVKRWKNKITNHAIQEVHSAKGVYHADHAIVVCSTSFTPAAMRTAKTHEIELVGASKLKEWIAKYPIPKQEIIKNISDITIDDIYNKYPNYKEIIQKIVQFVLKDRERDITSQLYGRSMIRVIKSKLEQELLSPTDQTECFEKILEMLKDGYSIDLIKDSGFVSTVTFADVEEDSPPPYDSLKSQLMSKISFLEAGMEGKQPIQEKILINSFASVSGDFQDPDNIRRILRQLIIEACIYESKPGYYNTV